MRRLKQGVMQYGKHEKNREKTRKGRGLGDSVWERDWTTPNDGKHEVGSGPS